MRRTPPCTTPDAPCISLGSNLGNRLETLQSAIDALEDTPGLRVKAVSPVYETEPWGVDPGSQPAYFNAVVRREDDPAARPRCWSAATPSRRRFDRVRDERWGPRTIDVDIVAYQDVVSDDPVLTLPHPRAHERAFVLVPWHDVDPRRRGARATAPSPSCSPRSARRASPRARTWNSSLPE